MNMYLSTKKGKEMEGTEQRKEHLKSKNDILPETINQSFIWF